MSQWIENRTLPKLGGCLVVELTFRFPCRQRREAVAGNYCQNCKDLDNLAKGVLDAFTGYLWDDDSQVVGLFCHKVWAASAGITLSVSGVDLFAGLSLL